MKTAMQELIEKLAMKSGDSFHALAFYNDNDDIIKEGLEKEKQQIINFCWECLQGDNIHTITSSSELMQYIDDKFDKIHNQ